MIVFRSYLITIISIVSVLLTSCGDHKVSSVTTQINPAFSEFLSAYSGGIISKVSNIQIKLTSVPDPAPIAGSEVNTNVFDFEPNIKGKAVWVDEKTIEFQPEEALDSGTEYRVVFKLGQLIDVPADLNLFEYIFKTINPDFEVTIEGLESVNDSELEKQKLKGVISTADFTDSETVKKLISVDFSGNNLPLT